MTRFAYRAWLTALTILGGLGLTLLWFNLTVFIPFSERLWTFFNDRLGGQDPGLASDLEFLSVLSGAALMCFGLVRRFLPKAR